jgi:hypothetical protein
MKARLTALLAVLTVCVWIGAAEPQAVTRPKTILVIRHAEKTPDSPDTGLNEQGKKRAEALPDLFKKSDTRPNPFPTPDFIFAAKESKKSNRPVETVTPLAKKLKLDFNVEYQTDEFPKLVEELFTNPKYNGKTVMISWRHGSIPKLVAKLGVTNAPEKWGDDVYDEVWVVTFDEKGKARPLVVRRQALLPGDRKE